MIVGVTGSIGAGKTSFAAALAEHLERKAGSPVLVINADNVVRELFLAEEQRGPAALDDGQGLFGRLAARFGRDLFDAQGRLDRKALAARAFPDETAAADLNAIVHPFVIAEVKTRMVRRKGPVILDVPLLFESGMHALCDHVIAVLAEDSLRRVRAAAFENFAERDRRQMPQDEKARRAHHVVRNNATLAELSTEALRVAENLVAGPPRL